MQMIYEKLPDSKDAAQVITYFLRQNGISQPAFAHYLGMSKTQMWKICKGQPVGKSYLMAALLAVKAHHFADAIVEGERYAKTIEEAVRVSSVGRGVKPNF